MQKSLFTLLTSLQRQLVPTLTLIFLLVGSVSAQTEGSIPTPDEVRDIVDSHLDSDGIVYGYMYIGGDIERLTKGINEALQVMREADPKIPIVWMLYFFWFSALTIRSPTTPAPATSAQQDHAH